MGNIKDYKIELKNKQIEVYNKNKLLIMLVFTVCNKVALQNQIEEILIHYNIYKDSQAIHRAINNLYDAKLIDKKKYNNLNVIILKNPSIRFIAEELNKNTKKDLFNSQSINSQFNDERLYTSIFKTEYYINYMKSLKSCKNLELDLYNLLDNNTLLYRRSRGFELLYSFVTKNITDRQKKEFSKYAEELKKQRKDKTDSFIKNKDKYKDEDKMEIFKNRGYDYDDIFTYNTYKKKKKNDKYNLNSILNTNNLILELDRYEVSQNTTDYAVTINNNRLYFNLYILDINNNLNYRKIADISKKTYIMLKELFCRETVYVSKNQNCMKCKYYFDNIDRLKKIGVTPSYAIACYPGTGNQRINCNEVHEKLIRELYLNVICATSNQTRAEKLKLECNRIDYDDCGKRDYANFKYRVTSDKKAIDVYEFDEHFDLSFVNYNTDRFIIRTQNNLEEYNRIKRQNALIKEELKENDELVQLLKLINEKMKNKNEDFENVIKEFIK